jgi:hypothetical protein
MGPEHPRPTAQVTNDPRPPRPTAPGTYRGPNEPRPTAFAKEPGPGPRTAHGVDDLATLAAPGQPESRRPHSNRRLNGYR